MSPCTALVTSCCSNGMTPLINSPANVDVMYVLDESDIPVYIYYEYYKLAQFVMS